MGTEGTTEVAGILIPSTSPFFLAMVGAHVLLGIAAVATGLGAMWSAKATGAHPRWGAAYFWLICGVVSTATVLTALRPGENVAVFVVGVAAFTSALVGRRARRGGWGGSLRVHAAGMGMSYVLLLTAFYVETGAQLPLWHLLPQAAFWVLPSLIGVPLIARTLARHPLLRRGGTSDREGGPIPPPS